MARLRKAAAIRRRLDRPDAAPPRNLFSDTLFAIELERWFPNGAPLEVEVGSGAGEFILQRAAATPERNFIAIELSSLLHRMVEAKAGRSELANLVVIHADARPIVNLFLPDRSVDAYHIYFPDPWPKKRHAKHRLFSTSFIEGLKRTLRADGLVYFATDFDEYARAVSALMSEAGFARRGGDVPGAATTRFARRYETEGRKIFHAVLRLSA